MYAMYFNSINTYIYKTVVICNHFRLHFIIIIHMFQWYQYAIMSTNFNHFAYLLMCSTHSSSMSPHGLPFLSGFKFYLFSIYFQCHFCCFNNYLHLVMYRNFNAFSHFSFPVVFHHFFMHLQLHI